jgi:glycosyltransferase involved in cell wall biosynthesis
MRVLAIDPFHGGSHRQFLTGVRDLSRHQWNIIPGKPVHWKWRMRSAPLELAATTRSFISARGYPDVLFCTDMLDLASFRGLLRDPLITELPSVVYFHENQWSYPVSPHARPDTHFGYTNLLSALAADACWFNSQFHRDDFFGACETFVGRMPDAQAAHDLDSLPEKSRVIPPGFASHHVHRGRRESGALTIGWVSRWEYDKRPDKFFELLRLLEDQGIDFQLILLGARPLSKPKDLKKIEQRFAQRIVHNGYAATTEQYWELLGKIDVVVATADHEFFGIAVCEAIWAGAIPILPNRLSYPELAIESCLFDSLTEAVEKIDQLCDQEVRMQQSEASRRNIQSLKLDRLISRIDDEIEALAGS